MLKTVRAYDVTVQIILKTLAAVQNVHIMSLHDVDITSLT